MGNTAGTSKRRSSMDDDYLFQASISGAGVGGAYNPYYPPKRKLILQASQAVPEDEPILSILAEGRTIDAIADQLRDSRLHDSSGKPTLYVGGRGLEANTGDCQEDSPQQTTLPTVFKWEGGGKEVYISGTFNGWKAKIPMVKSKQNFYTIIDLPEGEHQYKFIVDGQWKWDKNQPTATSSTGVQNNCITVNLSDFDVIEALANMDAVPTGSSPPGDYGQVVPPNPFTSATSGGVGLVTSAAQVDAKKAVTPPQLPPQLLQVILNRDTNVHCDPNLLPQPNHVMLNHMYALSIKDGVIVLSAITRYRQKFVSTVLYKPI